MKHDLETISPTRVKLTVEVAFDELKPSMDEAYKRIGSQVTIPGFRKGHVPARVIDQRFGRAAVLDEAVNEAVPQFLDDAIRMAEIVPVSRPEVEVTELADGDKLTFTAEMDIRPSFDVPDWSGLRVEVDAATPTAADIDAQVEALRSRFATLTDVDRAAKDGDVLLVDIAGATPEGDALEDLTGNALSVELGNDSILPGFDDAVRGAKKGDERTFEFTPQNGDWAGIPLVVTVKVIGVRERVLPPLDDDFAQLASEYDTVAELREDATKHLERMNRLQQGSQARQKVHEALLTLVDIPLPEGVIAAEVENHFSDGHGHHGDGDADAHRAEVEQQARESLKGQFILDKIADTEQVSVGESELSAWLVQQAPQYGMGPEEFAQALVQAGQVPMAIQDIRRAKTLALVLEQASVVDANGKAVDLNELEADLAAAMGSMPSFEDDHSDHDHDHDHDHTGHDHSGHDH